METYEEVTDEVKLLTVNLKLADESVRPVEVLMSQSVAELKQAVRGN